MASLTALTPGCAGAEACQPIPVQCAKDADCGPNEFCGVNGLCYIKVDQHGSTARGSRAPMADHGRWHSDSFDNDGDCYCEVVVCTGDANKDGKCEGGSSGAQAPSPLGAVSEVVWWGL